MAYFVRRRDKTGIFVNTLCKTPEEASHKAASLREKGIKCWAEDGDGNPIDGGSHDKLAERAAHRSDNDRRAQ